MRMLLIILTVLMMWGPPRLRTSQRPLEIAFTDPWNLDFAAVLQAGVWVSGAAVVAILVGGHALKSGRLLPKLVWMSPLKYYMLFGALALGSAAYSVSPLYTLFYSSKIIISILAVSLLSDRASVSGSRPLILKLYFAVNVLQWIANSTLYFVAPHLVGAEIRNVGYRLYGGILEEYGTAAVCAGVFFQSQAMFYARGYQRFLYWSLYVLTWIFVLMSRTRSAVVTAAVVFIVMTALHRKSSARVMAAIGLVIAVGLFAIAGGVDPLIEFGLRGQDVASFTSLTGRSTAFSYLLEAWKGSPWLGFGYAAGSRYLLILFVKQSGLGIGSPHDALSKMLTDLGIVGTAFLVGLVIYAWVTMFRVVRIARATRHAHALALQLVSLLTLLTLTGFVSPSIAEIPFSILVIVVGSVVVPSHVRRARGASAEADATATAAAYL